MRVRQLVTGGLLVSLAWVNLGAGAGEPPLVSALKRGQVEVAHTLVKRGADVNASEMDGTTALHWAVRSGDVETTALLIRHGANVTAPNRYGATPLWLAAGSGNTALVDMLLAAGADAKATIGDGETVLMAAARTNAGQAIRSLIKHGADPNATERWYGQTALMWAAAENRPEAARALIEGGARLNVRSTVLENVPNALRDMTLSTFAWGGFTPMLFAARQGSFEAADVLIEAGADTSVKEPEFGITPLLIAITNGHFDVAALLVEKGKADLALTDETGRAALYAAVEMHSPEHIINRPPPRPSGKLDSLDLVKILLEHGANPNAQLRRAPRGGGSTQGEGATPLMRAAKTADVSMMRVLLDHGADPYVRLKRDHTTVLMVAAGLGWSYGSASYGGKPVSERAAVDAVALCLDHGLDINASNSDGTTALHGAASKGADTVVQFLATKGARLDARDKRGRTPLDVALGVGARTGLVQSSHESTVVLLRQLMADGGKGSVPDARQAH
jgi:ankyrin repeat protein